MSSEDKSSQSPEQGNMQYKMSSFTFPDPRDPPLGGKSPKDIEKEYPGLKVEILGGWSDVTKAYLVRASGMNDVMDKFITDVEEDKI